MQPVDVIDIELQLRGPLARAMMKAANKHQQEPGQLLSSAVERVLKQDDFKSPVLGLLDFSNFQVAEAFAGLTPTKAERAIRSALP